MPRASLTAASVERLKPPKFGQVEYYDRRMPAFGLRLSYRGAKSWFLMTRVDGRLVRITLGRYPALSLAAAREEARKASVLSASGSDPRQVRAASKEKQTEERRNTFGVCAEEFLSSMPVAGCGVRRKENTAVCSPVKTRFIGTIGRSARSRSETCSILSRRSTNAVRQVLPSARWSISDDSSTGARNGS